MFIPFFKKKSCVYAKIFTSCNNQCSLFLYKNENENNEVKAASIFQLCEFKESCDIICGYLLKEKKFFFAPIKCKLMNSKSIKITKIDDIDTNNELFTNFYNKILADFLADFCPLNFPYCNHRKLF